MGIVRRKHDCLDAGFHGLVNDGQTAFPIF